MKAQKHAKLATLPHILVVDDDDRIRQLLSRYLQDNDFIVCTAPDAAIAKQMLENLVFDALVLDIMMPGQSGLELTQELRAQKNSIPVILLTALGEVDDRVAGFEKGADDYLPKPFEPKELVFRLQSILRRHGLKYEETVRPFRVGIWTYDPDRGTLNAEGKTQKLTAVEVNLLEALASRAGQAVSRDELAALCALDAGERTIDVQVTRLRRKFEEDTRNPLYLQTVRGKGYLLRTESL